jgi:hypothetical protein
MTVSPAGGAGFVGKRTDTEEGKALTGSRGKVWGRAQVSGKSSECLAIPWKMSYDDGALRGATKNVACGTPCWIRLDMLPLVG